MKPCDFILIVPTPEEFRVISEICKLNPLEIQDGIQYYSLESSKIEYKGIAVLLGGMGNTTASQITEKVLNYLDVNAVFLIGIAGAIDDVLRIGDVIVANEVNEYRANSKITNKEELFSGRHWDINPNSVNCVINFQFASRSEFEEWRTVVRNFIAELESVEGNYPNYYVGHLASGNTVLSSTLFKNIIREKIDRKTLVVEMEAAGVIQATKAHNKKLFIIRGVSDFADDDKSKAEKETRGEWRKLAVYSATHFFLNLLNAECMKQFLKDGATPSQGDMLIKQEIRQKILNDEKPTSIMNEYYDFLTSLPDSEWIKKELSYYTANDPNPEHRRVKGYFSGINLQRVDPIEFEIMVQGGRDTFTYIDNLVLKQPLFKLEQLMGHPNRIIKMEFPMSFWRNLIPDQNESNESFVTFFYMDSGEIPQILMRVKAKILKMLE
ncbi:MAG: hypothetical protein HWN66_06175 [Candidatus Helarchaeota archaeon]|nr:hypothetical protein [Candidatus Helarchaeota archaeon]